MTRLTMSSVGVALLATIGFTASASAASFGDMVKHVPGDANVVVLFNVQQILDSPMAKSGGWKESHDQAFAAGMVFLPPTATRFIMASRMDMETFTPIWEVVLMDMGGTSFSLAGLAREYGGKIDKVGTVDAVYLPTDKYAVKLSDSLFGARAPGERQATARWVADVGTVQRLAPYIQQAIGYSDRAATDVIMAMDIGDMFSAAEIETRLAGAESLANKTNVDIKAIARTLASIRGVTLGIRLGERPYGVLKVEFKESAKPLAGHGKALLLEALGRRGAMIDDFADWDPKTEENLISIEGYLTEDGMRKIFSIFQVSSVARSVTRGEGDTEEQGQGAEADAQKVIAATKQYYNNVQKMFKELKDKEPQRMSQYGAWFEKYAAKIDNLPLVGVDKDMLDYGRYVAQSMRSASMVVKNRGISAAAGEVQAAATEGYGYDYAYGGGYANRWTGNAGWGYGTGTVVPSYTAYLGEQQSRRTQVRVAANTQMSSNLQQIIASVNEATAHIRLAMAEKYEINL